MRSLTSLALALGSLRLVLATDALLAGEGGARDPDARSEGLLSVAQTLNNGEERQAVLDELLDEQDLAQSVIEDGPSVEKEDPADLIGNASSDSDTALPASADAASAEVVGLAAPAHAAADISVALPTAEDASVAMSMSGKDAAPPNSVAEAQLTKYEQDRLSAAELENVQLRKMLSQADSYESGLWAKMKTFKETAEKTLKKAEGELKAVPKLKQRVTELSSLLEQEKKKESAQQKKLKALKLKFAVATQRTVRNNKALNLVRTHLKSLEAQNSQLLQQIRNASAASKSVHQQMNVSQQKHSMLMISLQDLQKQLRQNSTTLDSALKDTDKAMQTLRAKMQATDEREKEILKTQQESEGKVNGLRKQLDEQEKELSDVKQQEEKVKVHASDLAMQVKKGRLDEKTEFHKLRETASDVRSLQKEAKALQKKQLENKQASEKTKKAYDAAKADLQQMESEIKKLRGNAPWLEAKVKAEQTQAQDEEKKTRQAYEERDTAKAMLEQANAKLAQLQDQYAGVVTVLGESDSKATAATPKTQALRGSQEPAKTPPTQKPKADAAPAASAKQPSTNKDSADDGSDLLDQAMAEDDDILSQTAALAEDNLLSDE